MLSKFGDFTPQPQVLSGPKTHLRIISIISWNIITKHQLKHSKHWMNDFRSLEHDFVLSEPTMYHLKTQRGKLSGLKDY